MTDSQYLTNAVDFIVEREQDNDYICERLLEIPKEFEICVKTAKICAEIVCCAFWKITKWRNKV